MFAYSVLHQPYPYTRAPNPHPSLSPTNAGADGKYSDDAAGLLCPEVGRRTSTPG